MVNYSSELDALISYVSENSNRDIIVSEIGIVNRMMNMLVFSEPAHLKDSQIVKLNKIQSAVLSKVDHKFVKMLERIDVKRFVDSANFCMKDIFLNIDLFKDITEIKKMDEEKQFGILNLALNRISENEVARFSSYSDLTHFVNVATAIGSNMSREMYLESVRKMMSILNKSNRNDVHCLELKDAIIYFIKNSEVHIMPSSLMDSEYYHSEALTYALLQLALPLNKNEKEAFYRRFVSEYCNDHLELGQYLFRPSSMELPLFSENHITYFFTLTNKGVKGLENRRLVWQCTNQQETWARQFDDRAYGSLNELVNSIFDGHWKRVPAPAKHEIDAYLQQKGLNRQTFPA